MSRLRGELTLEEIDDWFTIGAKSVRNSKTVPRTATGGRFFNPETQTARAANENAYVPSYHQSTFNTNSYAESYQLEEEQDLLNAHSQTNDGYVGLAGKMEHLDLESIVSGSVAVPDDLVPENANDVYKNYDFNHRYDTKLPITQFRDQVLATIESNQVTVIQGSTGSGKTTQVPQYILDHYASMGKYCNIIVTQPRRIAAISIARRVCNERKWECGTVCGYQVGMDKTANEDTRLLYVTTGVLLRKLIKTKNMLHFTHVILDEVHERDQDTDFSLLVVRKLLRTNSRHVKVVLMSATFDSDLFGQYFALPIRDHLEPAPVVIVEGKAYNVSEYYADDLTQLGEIPPLSESKPEISKEAYFLALKLIQEFDNLDAKKFGMGTKGFAHYRGTVLVFLPGYMEIENMQKLLKEVELQHNLVIYPLHSTITLEEQAKVFRMPEEGERKVILSTNIAESSITVPDIKYVIDFCLTKNLISDTDTNYTSLQVEWASRANCTQRKGRAGRVSDGRVYRMITRFFWEAYIPDYGIPEMQRCPLEQLILQVKLLDLGQPKAVLALALTPPNLNDIERTILLLKEVGALSTPATGAKNPHDGRLTFVGRVLAELPVDVRIGKLLMLGHVFGLLEECLIIGAALSLKSLFSKPFKEHLNSFRHKLEWSRGSLSDQLTILNAYQEWVHNTNTGAYRSGQNEMKWGRMHYLQIRRLRETRQLVEELEQRLSQFNIQKHKATPNYKKAYKQDDERLLLKLIMCGAFYPHYFLKGEVDEEEALRMMSGHDPLETVMVKGLPANQGSLYKQALEDQFRTIAPHPTAFFEETRAYIKFPKKERTVKVHPGVYLSVKHRLLRQQIELTLYSAEEANEKMEEIRKQQEKFVGRLRSNRLTVGDGGMNISEQSLQREPPSAETTAIPLHVTEVVDCGHFWAQYAEEKTQQDLYQIQSSLNLRGELPQMHREFYLRRGMYVAAPFEGELYRARVENVEREQDSRSSQWIEIVEVFFVDFGNTEKMHRGCLREIPRDYLSVPFQAVECKLSEIRPSPVKCPDGTWTNEAKDHFKHMVIEKNFIGQLYSIVNGVLRLELMECLLGGRQISINKELISRGFADVAEENYLSKQSHEQREIEATSVNVINPFKPEQESKPTFQDRQNDWFHVKVDGSRPRSKQGRRTQRLNGPHNPYEMMFNSLTSVGRLRSVKIDPDSVNCAAIDDEPQDRHDRLMIAGFVGLNPGGSSMIARDTSIMPSIPGLPSLVALLFCPVAELRTDRARKKYTGAICGLGVDKDLGYPAFPDHDMEITFDVKITHEDICKINGVRMAINLAIGYEEKVSAWGPDAIYKIQETSRRKLLEVIKTRRESVEPDNCPYPYQWNKVDPEDLVDTSLEGTPADSPVLLNLHKAVVLADLEELVGDKSNKDSTQQIIYQRI